VLKAATAERRRKFTMIKFARCLKKFINEFYEEGMKRLSGLNSPSTDSRQSFRTPKKASRPCKIIHCFVSL